MKHYSILSLMALGLMSADGAVSIYTEDFTDQAGKGIIGATGGIPDTDYSDMDVTWTLADINLGAFTATTDWVKVDSGISGSLISGEALSYQDVDGPVKWLSPEIDVSLFTSLGLNIDVEELGDLEPADYIDIAFILDGGTPQIYAGAGFPHSDGSHTYVGNDGATSGDPEDLDFMTDQFSGSVPDGTTVQIQITASANISSEVILFDNIELVGEAIPEPSSSLLLALFGGLGTLRRRRNR